MKSTSALRTSLGLALLAFATRCSAQTASAFIWSPSDQLIGGFGMRANYQVLDSAAVSGALLQPEKHTSMIDGLSSEKLQSADNLITILVYGQATRSSLSSQSMETLALKRSTEAAASSIYLANIQAGGQAVSVEELKSRLTGKRLSVRVCEDGSSSLFTAVEEAVQESKQPYVMAYFGQPEKAAEGSVGRTLLQAPASQKLCSDKCRTQVMLFECIILLVILLWALWIGTNMLHILDTPSKFETEKKEQSRHQD